MKALLAACFIVLSACSPAVVAQPAGGAPAVAAQPVAIATPAATPSLAATPSVAPLPVATPTPAAASPAAPPAPPVAPQPVNRAGTFALVPFGAHGATGSVIVSVQGSGFAVAVRARNLTPGSLHTVHLHAGSCAGAYLGRHLLVLGTMEADGAGSGGLRVSLGFPYATGRYVIVYSNLAAVTIIGCADLGAI